MEVINDQKIVIPPKIFEINIYKYKDALVKKIMHIVAKNWVYLIL